MRGIGWELIGRAAPSGRWSFLGQKISSAEFSAELGEKGSLVIAFTFDRSDQDPEVGDDEEDKAGDLKARDDARPVPPFVEGGRRKVCQGMGSAKIISQRVQEDSEDKAEEEALFGRFSSHRGSAP